MEGVPKREGYMSPGTDIRDSAGEASNLTWGVEVVVCWLSQVAILAFCDGSGGCVEEDLVSFFLNC